MPGRPYTLDAKTLAGVGATGRPLALSAAALDCVFPPARADVAPGADGSYLPPAEKPSQAGSVAVVSIMGPLAQRGEEGLCALVDGYDWIAGRLGAALESDAAGVVLVIDSPGGDAAGLVEGVRRMRSMVEASGKPVVAYVDEQAASAAYWIASGVADAVYVPPTGRVGSIGCLIVHTDVSGAAAADGVRYTIVRDPAGKAAGSPLEPLSDVAMSRMRRDVSELSNAFAASVASRRGMSLADVRALDGDMRMGAAAVAAGLADGVATLEQVVQVVAARAAEESQKMNSKQAVAALLGVCAAASEAEIVAAVARATPVLALGAGVMRLAEAADAESAEGTIRAWRDGAARSTETATELAKLREAEKARAAAEDARERVAALTDLVAAGKMSPAEAWADPVQGTAGGIAEHFAEMKPKTFKAFVAGRAGVPSALAPSAKPVPVGLVEAASDIEEARVRGVSVESWREAKKRFAAATQGA